MEAVVFDCDGVLVDSEPIALEIWSDMLSSYGTPFTEDEVTALVGVSDADAHGRFAGRAGMPPAERFLADFAAERDARFRSSLRAFDDALATVRRLAGDGIAMAVASNAPRASLDLALEVTGIGRYLPVAVSSDDVAAPKPAPHVYLEAAARLGVRAERCLAIEDSAAGATAARAAGMRVVTVARHAAPIPGYAFVPALDPDTISIWLGRS